MCALTEINVLFLYGQIVDRHSGFIDQAKDMVNLVSVNEVEYSKLSYVDNLVDWSGVISQCGKCELQGFNKE